MRRTSWRVRVGIAVAGALLATACGSSGSSSSGTSTTTKPDLSALGPVKRATGAPLQVGYIYAGQAQNVDNRPELAMAQAVVKYTNEHLGGVAGRPLEIVSCTDHLTPAGATDCANQMLAAKVPVVISANPVNSAPILDLLKPAKIPFFVQTAAEASVLMSPASSVMGNPIVIVAAPIRVAQKSQLKKVAMINVDLPAAAGLKAIAQSMFQKAGLDLLYTAVPLGTPDVTPQVQAAISNGAQQIVEVGDLSLCINTLKALKTLGFKGPVMTNMNCLTDPSAKAISGGFEGLQVLNQRISDPAEPEVKLMYAVAAKYAPGTVPTEAGQAAPGYQAMLGFVRAMKGLTPGNATGPGISAALLAMPPTPLPLLPGQTFQCNRKVSTLTPSVCSNGVAVVTVDKSGKATKTEIFDATPYL